MFVCEYVLSWKLFSESDAVEDVIINLIPDATLPLADFKYAWYLGCADGAPCSRIVLIDSESIEYILPIRMSTEAQHRLVHNFFVGANSIRISELPETDAKEQAEKVYQMPLTSFASEQAMILARMTD